MTRADLRKGPLSWMARHPIASNLLMLALIAFGVIMSGRMGKEVFPSVQMDYVTISITYPGASPAEVENGVVRVVEEAVQDLEGVKEITATAQEGVAVVRIELNEEADADRALADVKNAVDRITTLPEDAERPVVGLDERIQFAIMLAVYGDADLSALHELAERARDDLRTDPKVTRVEVGGVPSREIAIEVPADTLRRHDLTLSDIAARIAATALERPAGGVDSPSGEVLLRTAERRDRGGEFADIPLLTGSDGRPVRLDELATIEDGYADVDMELTFSGHPSVLLSVFSVGSQSPTEVADAVKAYAAALEPSLPPGIHVQTFGDMSALYEAQLDLLLRNAALGLVLVLVVLGLFLEPKLAFWVTMGIPISFLGAFVLLPSLGITLNMISLFAFIVTLGIVVDDAIVIGENIFRWRNEGLSRMDAAVRGVKEMATPVFFSVATTVAAFMPLLFLPGGRGKMMWSIPVVVILVLVMSLIESFFILPAHLAHSRPGRGRGPIGWLLRLQKRFSNGVEAFVRGPYSRFVGATLRHRVVTLAAAVALLAVGGGLVAGGHVRYVDFPREESDLVSVTAQLPYGTPFSESRALADKLVQAADEAVAANGGPSISKGVSAQVGTPSGSNTVELIMLLVPLSERPASSAAIADAWREALGPVPGLESISFATTPRRGASSPPISLRVVHRDEASLEAAARDLAAAVGEFGGVTDVDDGIELGKPQIDLAVSDAGAAAGLTSDSVARQVRSAFYGVEALRQQRGRDEVKVVVRLPKSERSALETFDDLYLRTPAGGEMPLRDATTQTEGRAYSIIKRVDARRALTVTGEIDEEQANAQQVVAAVFQDIVPTLQARYPGLTVERSGRQQRTAEFFDYLGTAYVMALLAMFALLALPARSYAQPLFVVMGAIPFGLMGAVAAHWVLGMDLSMVSFLGMVALSGVIVNDSLVYTSAANELRAAGASPLEAARKAAEQRFRPILLTSLTTFFGLAPMIFETNASAQMIVPMAVSLGFGILFSTIVVLLVVPSLYLVVEGVREPRAQRLAELDAEDDDPSPRGGAGGGLPAKGAATALVALLALAFTTPALATPALATPALATPASETPETPAVTVAATATAETGDEPKASAAAGEALTLPDALRRAEERNPSLATLRTDIARAEAQLYQSWAALVPTAAASATWTMLDHGLTTDMGGETITTREQHTLTGQIAVDVPLIQPRQWLGVRTARQARDVTELGVVEARQQVLLLTAQAWFQAASSASLVEDLEVQRASTVRHQAVAALRHRSGTGARLDVLRADTQVAAIDDTLISARQSLANARDALGVLTGTDGLPTPVGDAGLVAPTSDVRALEATAQEQRPDLRRGRGAVVQAEDNLDATWMQFVPTVSARWQLDHQFTEPAGIGAADETSWTATFVLSVPLFDLTNYGNLDAERAAVDRARLELEDAEKSAAQEVREAVRAYQAALQRVAVAVGQADRTRETLTLTERAWVEGDGSSLDVNEARQSDREAAIDLQLRRLDANVALVTLLSATGADLRTAL